MATSIPVPQINRDGIVMPTFDDVHNWLQDAFRNIYGQDIYIEPDTQDGQLIGILALAFHDNYSVTEAVYNAFSPSTAQGMGLARVVKINGIRKNIPTKSVVDVRVIGVAGTVITAGIVSDNTDLSNARYLLPAVVTIPVAGEITVQATAEEVGQTESGPDTITNIVTPTRGWQSVTNPNAVVSGAPIETDAALRIRQTVSTTIPASTVFEGVIGAVAAIDGVTLYRGYENEDHGVDANGLPSHSISMVVQGGDPTLIAQTIAAKKAPGTQAYGKTTVVVLDQYGFPHNIGFTRPTQVSILANLPLRPKARYSAVVEGAIKTAVSDYINALPIGDDVVLTRIFTPANLNNDQRFELQRPATLLRLNGTPVEGDIVLAYDEKAVCTPGNVNIVVVP